MESNYPTLAIATFFIGLALGVVIRELNNRFPGGFA